jgi:conserved hypothetical protein
MTVIETPTVKNESTAKVRPWWIIRVVGSICVLSFTLWILPIHDVWNTIRGIKPSVWLFTFAVFLLGHVVSSTKWWFLIRKNDLPYSTALRAHFAGLMANLCLPGMAGGDVVRASLVARGSASKSRIAVGSVVDRVLDSFGLLLLSCAGALFAFTGDGWLDSPLVTVIITFVIALALIPAFIFTIRKLPQKPIVEKLRQAIEQFQKEPSTLFLCLGLSMIVQSAFIGLNIALATSSGIDVPVAAWFFAWPLSKLIATLPISMGGLGVREASLAALLKRFGAAPAQVVAVGLLWQTILYASGLFGGLTVFMSAKLRLSPAPDSQS